MAIVTTARAGMNAAGRATIIQLRAPQVTGRVIAEEASALVASVAVPVVVSSRCDVALAAGAAGVNLPENDIPVEAARRLLGERLVGRSVHSLETALRAEAEGADYVIFGPVWPSPSHPGSPPAGIEMLATVCDAVRIPVLAIGGMTEERITQSRAAGAAGYAAISFFT